MTAENPSQGRRPPFPVRNIPFFYGWVILGITFSSNMITAGIDGYAISFFVVPMSEGLGVSRAEFSAISLFRLIAIPAVPVIGLLLDRREGPRLVVTIASVAAGLALIASSLAQEMWQFYLAFGVVFGIVSVTLSWQLLGVAILAKWFVRIRGRAFAISTIGISTGGFVIAPIAGLLIDTFGWREAWFILGVGILVTLAPVAVIFMRRQPSDVGLHPDGISDSEATRNAEAGEDEAVAPDDGTYEYPWRVREAIRTGAFWAALAVQALGQAALFGVLFHQVAYMQDKGLSLADATIVAAVLAGVAIPSKILYGVLAERYTPQWVMAAVMIPAGATLMLLVVGVDRNILLVYAILYGLTMGGFTPVINVVHAHFFGREHIGAIRGVSSPVATVAGSLSPFIVAWAWEWYGDYDVAFIAMGVVWAIGGLLVLAARKPREPVAVAN